MSNIPSPLSHEEMLQALKVEKLNDIERLKINNDYLVVLRTRTQLAGQSTFKTLAQIDNVINSNKEVIGEHKAYIAFLEECLKTL